MAKKESKARATMQGICLITPENSEMFAPFLLTNARALLEAEEPVVALGYVEEQTACAAICGFIDGTTFEIISFYVAPDYRRKGIGTFLLSTLSEIAGDFATSVSIGFTVTAREHETLSLMLEKCGFNRVAGSGRNIFRTTLDKLSSSKAFNRDFGDLLPSFSEIDQEVLIDAQKQATIKGLPVPEEGFLGASVEQSCSTIYMKGNDLQSYIVVEKVSDGGLMVSGLANCTDNSMILMKTIHDAGEKGLDDYDEDTPVYMQAVNETSRKLLETIDSNAESIDRRFERRL